MNKEVTKTETNKAVATMPAGAWGTEGIRSENILIPQIYLMQGQSSFVQQSKAKTGEIIESVTGKILGSSDKPFEFIPISTFDTFMVQREDAPNDWKYLRTEKVTAENIKHREHANWMSKCPETGKNLKWTYELKFLVLPATNYETSLPHVLGFRSTSLRAGKALTNHFTTCKIDNIPPASKTMKVTSNKITRNGKTFSVYEVTEGQKTKEDQQMTAYKWFKNFQSGAAKVHESMESVAEAADDTADY